MPVIDIHSHDVPRGWPDLAERTGDAEPWPRLRLESERDAMILIGDREFRRITSQCWDPDVRAADMDADGVDVQVVSPTPVFFSYARSADAAAKVARIFNDLTLEICSQLPDRLV
ncbi:MAG: amidohydrolase, partial [Actinomycetota bacterium]